MAAVIVGAAKVVSVKLLQRAGTDRQHSSGAHVETVASQVVVVDVAMADDVEVGPSEVLGMESEDVEAGSDSEVEVGPGSDEDAEVGSVDVMVSSTNVEVSSSDGVGVVSSIDGVEVVSSTIEILVSDVAVEVLTRYSRSG